MAITPTGDFSENAATGVYEYGVGDNTNGGLTVNGGDDLALTASNASAEPRLDIGNGDNAVGAATVTGVGSTITMTGSGDTDVPGVELSVGSNGGDGTLNVLAGATFTISDLSVAQMLEPDYFGEEFIQVGRGGTGQINVDAATFSVTGGAPVMVIGRNDGDGTVIFDHNATLTMTSLALNDPSMDFSTADTGIVIGRQDNATGVLRFNNGSTGTLTAPSEAGAFMQIGRDTGTGTFELLGGSSFTLDGGGGGGFSYAAIELGRSGGLGILNVAAASHLYINNATGGAELGIGGFESNPSRFGGGTGVVAVTGNSSIELDGGTGGAQVRLGNRGGTGQLDLDGSQIKLEGDGFSVINIGQEDGSGYMTLTNGSLARIESATGAVFNVGRGEDPLGDDTFGQLDVYGSTVTLLATANGNAGLEVGSNGGTGLLTAYDATFNFTSQENSSFNIGVDGGWGYADISGGSTINLTATGGDPNSTYVYPNIGTRDGLGSLTLRGGSILNLTSDGGAGVQVGFGGDPADLSAVGEGELRVIGGARINIVGGHNPDPNNPIYFNSLDVGGTTGSTAKVIVSGGGVIDLDPAGGNDTNGSVNIVRRGGGTGSVLVDGAGSKIINVDYMQVGASLDDGPFPAGGNASLFIKNGGLVDTDFTLVGSGGTIGGYRGTLNGDVTLKGGGIDLRDGQIGVFDIGGDVDLQGTGNRLLLDVGANNGMDTVAANIGGPPGATLAITLNTLSGFFFSAGEQRTVLDLFSTTLPGFAVTGQSAHFGFYGGRLAIDADETIYFRALNAGNAGVANLAILDFGIAGPAALVGYNSATNSGSVKGGIFGSEGGQATNIDKFMGTNLNDVMTVVGATPRILSFDGRSGNDTFNGGFGVDTMIGGIGLDTLNGNNGNDILNGGNDNDTLFGGIGKDAQTGGSGNDVFKYTATNQSTVGANADAIADFDKVGNDTINLSAVYGGTLAYRHNLAFTAAGQVRINDIAGADVIVQVNTGGSLAADMEIRLTTTALATMTNTDFVL